jgi:hypothetical protein
LFFFEKKGGKKKVSVSQHWPQTDALVTFSGEEGAGRYLDLHAAHAQYSNLKHITRVDYITFLSQFDQVASLSSAVKQQGAYRKSVFYPCGNHLF